MKFLRLLLVPILALACLGMSRKPLVALRFHAEANSNDQGFSTRVKFSNPPRDGFIETVPTLTERDVEAVYPTIAEDATSGCVFKLTWQGGKAASTSKIA